MELRVKITCSFVYLYGPNIVDYLDVLTKVLGDNYSMMNMPRSRTDGNIKKDKILFFVGTSQYYTITRPEDFLNIMENFIENDIKFKIEKLITDYNVPITKYDVSNIMWNGEIKRYFVPVSQIIDEMLNKLLNGEFIEYDDIYRIIETYNTKEMIEKYNNEIIEVSEKIYEELYEIAYEIYYSIMKKIIHIYGLDVPDPVKVKKLIGVDEIDNETRKIIMYVKDYILSNPNVTLLGCLFKGDKDCVKEEVSYMVEDIVDIISSDENIDNIEEKVRKIMINLFMKVINSINGIDVYLKFIRKLMQSRTSDKTVKICLEKIAKELSNDMEQKLIDLYRELSSIENQTIVDRVCKEILEEIPDENQRIEKRVQIIDAIRTTLINTDKVLKQFITVINERSRQSYIKRLKEVVERVTRVDMIELRRVLLEKFPGKIIYDEKPTVKATEFPGMVIKIKIDPEDYKEMTRTSKKMNTVIIAFPNRRFSITNIRPSTVDIVFEIFKIMDEMRQRDEKSLSEIVYI